MILILLSLNFLKIPSMLNKILIQLEVTISNITYKKYRRNFNIAKSFRFNGKEIKLYGDGEFEFGDYTYIGSYSSWQSVKGCKIRIGKKCKISHNVRAYTQSAIADSDFSLDVIPQKKGNITIEDFAWIGANVLINPGITIGANSIIGANSVVTKDVLPFSIVGGVPAKLIRMKNIS